MRAELRCVRAVQGELAVVKGRWWTGQASMEAGGDLALAHVRRLQDPAAVARAHACKHLAALAARGDQTRAAIREAGAVEGLLPLLHAANTQVEAAGAIAALAVDAETRVLVRSAGGCAPLVQALQSKTIAAQEEAARALGYLARDEDGRIEIADLGGIVALVQLVQDDDRDMQLAAAGALNQLARNVENRVTIVGADGHDAMIEILRAGETPAPPCLQAEAAGTLANLAFYGPNKRKIREGGGLERLIGVLGSSSVEVADAAAAALSRLTKNDAECQAAVSAADGVRQLAALLWSESESTRQHARAAIENLGAHPEEEKAAWAKAKANERTGAVAEADQLRAKADESLLVGELDAAAVMYTEALALHPRSALLQRRLARTERERVSASSSIERLATRTTSVRQTRRKLASKAPDPLKLAGMPDGVLSLIEQFRDVDSRRRRDGIAAHLAPSFTSSRQQLDEAAAQLDSVQSALYRRSVESTPVEILPQTSSSASRLGSTIGDGYTAFAVGKETTLLPPDVKQLIQRRDDARRSFVQSADTFLSRLRAEAFQESHEAVVHVIGPLQHAADQLGSVPMLGPTALGEEAEALHEVEQDIDDDEYRESNRHISDSREPSESGMEKTKKYAPEAAALVAFDRWIADNTAATVGTKTDEAIARLLSCVSENLAPGTATSGYVQNDQMDNIDRNTSTGQQNRLLEAVREADARLATEQRYWQLADPIRSLPVGVIRRSAGALLRELTSEIEEVEAIYSYAELIEERRDAAMEWIEREDQDEPLDVTELVAYSDLAQACAEEMEEVTVTITSLRNELEQTRDNRRLQEMESKAMALRRRRYEAEKGLKAERKRLCQLAAEHYPELPLRFPGAGLRLDPQMPRPSRQEQFADRDHSKNTGKGGTVTATRQLQDHEAIAEGHGTVVMTELADLQSTAQGLGNALETEAEALAKMRKRLVDSERRLEQQRTAAAEQHDIGEGQTSVLDSAEASLQRQRRELLRRQRAFSLKCELAGRSARLVAPPAAWTDSMPEGTASLSDFLGGQTSSEAVPVPEPQPEPEPRWIGISPTVASSRTSGGFPSALRTARSAQSPARTMSSAPHATASPTPVGSDMEGSSELASVSFATRAASPPAATAAVTPTRSTNGRHGSTAAASSDVSSLLRKREALVEVEADAGEEALGSGRNSTMKAAARRAEQRLRLRPETATRNRSDEAQQAVSSTSTATAPAAEIGEQPKQLTRLERARQQASVRISTGDKLIAAGGTAAEGRQLRTRSPSPPRTLSARMSAAQQEQGRARAADSGLASGRSSPITSSPAFRQPRTASELNAAPTPPPMSPFRGSGEHQPNYTDSNQANAPTDGLSKTITARVRETMGVSASVTSATPYGTGTHAMETVLEAMDKDDDGAVSRNEYTSYPRSVQATMAYAQYTAGMYHWLVALTAVSMPPIAPTAAFEKFHPFASVYLASLLHL